MNTPQFEIRGKAAAATDNIHLIPAKTIVRLSLCRLGLARRRRNICAREYSSDVRCEGTFHQKGTEHEEGPHSHGRGREFMGSVMAPAAC